MKLEGVIAKILFHVDIEIENSSVEDLSTTNKESQYHL
jgi:hypothetical protein